MEFFTFYTGASMVTFVPLLIHCYFNLLYRYGRPKRDISTIIHILNDLLCAAPPVALAQVIYSNKICYKLPNQIYWFSTHSVLFYFCFRRNLATRAYRKNQTNVWGAVNHRVRTDNATVTCRRHPPRLSSLARANSKPVSVDLSLNSARHVWAKPAARYARNVIQPRP